MAKAFLTNATGYIGEAVAKNLKTKGYEVTALARTPEAQQKLEQQGIHAHRGDLKQPETYVNDLRNYDVVIHTAATNDQDYAKYDTITIEKVFEALKGTNRTFIYTSGTWVLGNTTEKPADETAATPANSPVAWRSENEQKVIAAAQHGIRTIVIRPTIVYGETRGIVGNLVEDLKQSGTVHFIGTGENQWANVHVQDLAELYALAIEKAPTGSVYNVANEKSIKVKEVAEQIAKAYGTPGKVTAVPVEQARQRLGTFADGLALDQRIDSSKAKRELGWQPKQPQLLQEIEKTVRTPAGAVK